MAKKRKGPGRSGSGGGRYTAPSTSAGHKGIDQPLSFGLPDSPSPRTQNRETTEFWADLDRQGGELRARCAALLGDLAPSDSDWMDADLASMDGVDATDEELIAYWATFRESVKLDLGEPPDLRFVTDALDEGADPVQRLRDAFT